jgi:hypothetical protein
MLNLSWDLAIQKADEAKAATDAAIAQAANPTQMVESGLTYSVVVPTPPTLIPFDPNSADARYQAYEAEIAAFLTGNFTTFITQFYPTSAYLTYAQAWIERALTTGGTGLNASIEAQLWERDRSRLMRENDRARDEITSRWTGKGYPLPPGAFVSELARLDDDLRDKIAQASRDVAIKSFDTEIENIRFAVGQALALRQQALSLAFDYIRALALAPNIGAQVSTAIAEVETRMVTATTALYAAQVQAAELPLRIATTDAELRQRAKEANLKSSIEAQHDRVVSATAAANSLGSVAAASVNALHANVGLGGTEQL